jgi:YVTN family beta-propeller protein
MTGEPARKIVSGAEVRQHDILKTAGLENVLGRFSAVPHLYKTDLCTILFPTAKYQNFRNKVAAKGVLLGESQYTTNKEGSMFPRSRYLLRQLSRAGAMIATLVATTAFAGGPKAYVGNFKDNTVSAIDTAAGAVVATMPVAKGPHGMAITQDGRTVYVSGDGSSSVDVIDTATDKVVKTINVGKAPNGVALTPDDRLLVVTVYGEDRIAFIDTSTQTVVANMVVPKPHTVAISPNGKLAYVTVQEPGHFGLALIDIATRSLVRTLALDKTPRDGEFGYDGKLFYFTQAGVSSVQVLDPASDRIVAQIPTGVSPHFVSYPRGSAFGIVVVQGPSELLLFDPATNKPARSIAVGKQPHWATASGDGKTAYVTNEGSNDFTVVDLTNGRTTTIAVGNAPRKVVVQRGSASAGKGM